MHHYPIPPPLVLSQRPCSACIIIRYLLLLSCPSQRPSLSCIRRISASKVLPILRLPASLLCFRRIQGKKKLPWSFFNFFCDLCCSWSLDHHKAICSSLSHQPILIALFWSLIVTFLLLHSETTTTRRGYPGHTP